MVRVIGHTCIWGSFFILGVVTGWEAALYHGSVQQLAEAAKLRIRYEIGIDP